MKHQEMQLSGRVALMTASGSGIGQATAVLFAREGAKVVVNDVRAEAGVKTVNLIEQEGGTALFFEGDVSDARKVEEMVDFAVARLGRLDILFNNAAYMDPKGMQPITDLPIEIWDRSIAVGLRSYFLGCKFAIPAMLRNGGGVIVNISSVGGMEGSNWFSHYNCVKAAIINLTRNLALDYARQNIRSVCICPGTIATPATEAAFSNKDEPFRKRRQDMRPTNREGRPEEVAALALFLVSDDASFINGASIPIDGGFTAGKFIHNYAEIVGTPKNG